MCVGGVSDAALAADDGLPPDLSEVLSLSVFAGGEELRWRTTHARSSPRSMSGGTTQGTRIPSRSLRWLMEWLIAWPSPVQRSALALDDAGIAMEMTPPPVMPPATMRLPALEVINAAGDGAGELGGCSAQA